MHRVKCLGGTKRLVDYHRQLGPDTDIFSRTGQ